MTVRIGSPGALYAAILHSQLAERGKTLILRRATITVEECIFFVCTEKTIDGIIVRGEGAWPHEESAKPGECDKLLVAFEEDLLKNAMKCLEKF